MDCKVSGSGETLMEKCMEVLVHTENWQFYPGAAQGPERTVCLELSEKGVSLSKMKGKFLPPISQQHEQVLLFL